MTKAKTLGEIRKEIQHDTCTDVRRIMQMFIKICNDNPDAVKASFSDFLKSMRPDEMVTFYQEQAQYLAELFDNR